MRVVGSALQFWGGRWRHSFSSGADGCCSADSLFLHRLPLFPFLCEMLKFEGSLGKVRNCSGFIVSLQSKSVIIKND